MQSVTATRRRPTSFENLKGQDFVAKTLRSAMEKQAVANAYLFYGPRGCGKTSAARLLAKALNCEATGKVNPCPCGKCASCLAISKSSSVDVLEIDGASNTSVNDVRRIKEEILFPPNTSRYKIYIIDEVHMLSSSAFNALLKTIEEPPPFVVFIFATTELHKLPVTIKSRCQKYAFRLVDVKTIKSLLEEAARELGIDAEEEALYFIAREGKGSVRDAYTLFDQIAAFSKEKITYEKIKTELNLLDNEDLQSLFSECAQNNTKNALLKLEEIFGKGIDVSVFVRDSCKFFRNLLFLKNGVEDEEILEENPASYGEIVRNAWNGEQLEVALSMFLDAYREIRYTLSAKSEIELVISRLSWLTSYVSSREIKEMLNNSTSSNSSSLPYSKAENAPVSFSSSAYSGDLNEDDEAENEEPEEEKEDAKINVVAKNGQETAGEVPLFSALKKPAAKKYAASESETPKESPKSFPKPESKAPETEPIAKETDSSTPQTIPASEVGENAKIETKKEKTDGKNKCPIEVQILCDAFNGTFSVLPKNNEEEQ